MFSITHGAFHLGHTEEVKTERHIEIKNQHCCCCPWAKLSKLSVVVGFHYIYINLKIPKLPVKVTPRLHFKINSGLFKSVMPPKAEGNFNFSDAFCKLMLIKLLSDGSIFWFWNASMKHGSQYTVCIQVAGLDRVNYISTASWNSKWNKEMIKNENYFYGRKATENRWIINQSPLMLTPDTWCIMQGWASFQMYIRCTAVWRMLGSIWTNANGGAKN